jgi:hypothetical protein
MSEQIDPIEGYYAQRSTPTARKLIDVIQTMRCPRNYENCEGEYGAILAARVEAVLGMHYEPHPKAGCDQCDHNWPCPTVRALNGKP